MKRSDFFIRLTTGVLFLAVVSYIGVYVYNALMNTFVTATATSFAIEETFSAQGYVVRTERVLPEYGADVLPIVGDGERVASGQVIAVEYLSREALETADEIRTLRLRIAQLEASGLRGESARFDSITDLSRAVQTGNLSRLDELALNIETLVFADSPVLETGLPALQARLETLERRLDGVRTITTPASGTFSQIVDGFEHVEPKAIYEISPTGLTELFSTGSGVAGFGKLVTEFKWFFAAVMAAEDAVRLSAGGQMVVQFSGNYNAASDMLIESIGKPEDDFCVVLFSSDRRIHEAAPLRQLHAEVLFGVITGIRVPKEAIHLDDNGVIFVYLQTGVRAERVNVEILLESGDSYLVRDGTDAGTPLRAGATIIVKANDLFDGKVVA